MYKFALSQEFNISTLFWYGTKYFSYSYGSDAFELSDGPVVSLKFETCYIPSNGDRTAKPLEVNAPSNAAFLSIPSIGEDQVDELLLISDKSFGPESRPQCTSCNC